MSKDEILRQYGGKVRTRVCGILVDEGKLLLVKHNNLGQEGKLWVPPGGGVEFGVSFEENLRREFKEETNLDIEVCDFLFGFELLEQPLHAIELFFEVKIRSGKLKKGYDPEFESGKQIIEEVKMMHFDEMKRMNQNHLHGMLRKCGTLHELLSTRGFFKFENNI